MMKIGACVYNNKDDYNDGLYCNEYSFDCHETDDFSEFLNLLTMCLKNEKYIVLFSEERGNK